MNEANDKDAAALETYLSGDSELSRRYRGGGSPQPSASVDRAILEAAREEVAAPTSPRRRSKRAWERPLAIAAAVTLSAILFVSVQREEQSPAAPKQQADGLSEARSLSDRPASSEAARPGEAPAARGAGANGVSKKSDEADLRLRAVDDRAIEDALALIRMTWASGETERAEQLLEAFREEHPEVGDERLREMLPAALLDKDESR
jgi:hypothetical protein